MLLERVNDSYHIKEELCSGVSYCAAFGLKMTTAIYVAMRLVQELELQRTRKIGRRYLMSVRLSACCFIETLLFRVKTFCTESAYLRI